MLLGLWLLFRLMGTSEIYIPFHFACVSTTCSLVFVLNHICTCLMVPCSACQCILPPQLLCILIRTRTSSEVNLMLSEAHLLSVCAETKVADLKGKLFPWTTTPKNIFTEVGEYIMRRAQIVEDFSGSLTNTIFEQQTESKRGKNTLHACQWDVQHATRETCVVCLLWNFC